MACYNCICDVFLAQMQCSSSKLKQLDLNPRLGTCSQAVLLPSDYELKESSVFFHQAGNH